MNNPVILVLTKEIDLYYTFRDNIREVFGNSITLRSNHFLPVYLEDVDLILSSVPDSLVKDFINIEKTKAPLLVANRSIDFKKLEKLFELPRAAQCLLVSNDEAIACESVTMLKYLGFDYLDFYAYSPDMENPPDLKNIDIAITHGLANLVPKGLESVIDLGNRRLDLSTLFDISKILQHNFDHAHHITMGYVKNVARIGRELANSVRNENYINSSLQAVLNTVQEGVVFIDNEGRVSLFNEEAGSILGIDSQAVLYKHYSDVLDEFQIDKVMETKQQIPRQMIQVHGLNLLATLTPILQEGSFSGIVLVFQDVTHVERMEQEIRNKKLQSGLTTKYSFEDNVGNSMIMMQTQQLAKKIARSDYTVLITGESGTGKEIFAQSIHEYSSRNKGPFVAVNFAGISESLAESELFGYAEGAFTGARKGGKAGLFELAQNGTIFLDEIGDAPLKIQAAILRVLQEKQVMRVGGSTVIPVNVRVIAATNKQLEDMIRKGEFRDDLFYRLNQLPLRIPSLQERKEDIPDLITYFLKQKNSQLSFSPAVMEKLSSYRWPGNVRELEGLITYLSVIVNEREVSFSDLPFQIQDGFPSNMHPDKITRLLEHSGDLHLYKDILECLMVTQGENAGIGRSTLQAMLSDKISESKLRTKLDILKKYGLVETGIKKQGTKITNLGINMIEHI
ncbi:sigma-54 interaction domain-containing protein [Oceanobacillus jeddahense]|uniref:Sigma 54-interacting transcriptional regulator n=1 Tax=Oceanobacillus jeddahense TaxID=1462527 RepID=A0ABY5JWW6_9BACI|nr:sigma 54-interacting transcriptional regulator [Oceanobacillus jeddahense]UUI04880.1 sigma 54-interacting transcriptional regulator [Oceanobacillus jeddahense]